MSLTIQNIPAEILVNFFEYTDLPTLGRSAQVCKLWNQFIGTTPAIWAAQIGPQKSRVYYDCTSFFLPLSVEKLTQELTDKMGQQSSTENSKPAEAEVVEQSRAKIRLIINCLQQFRLNLATRKEAFFDQLLKETPDLLTKYDIDMLAFDAEGNVIGNPVDPRELWAEFWGDATRILIRLALNYDYRLIFQALHFELNFNAASIFNTILIPLFKEGFEVKIENNPLNLLRTHAAVILGLLTRKKQPLPNLYQTLRDRDIIPRGIPRTAINECVLDGLTTIKGLKISDYLECGLFEKNSRTHIDILVNCRARHALLTLGSYEDPMESESADLFYKLPKVPARLIELFREGMELLTLDRDKIANLFVNWREKKGPSWDPFNPIIDAKVGPFNPDAPRNPFLV